MNNQDQSPTAHTQNCSVQKKGTLECFPFAAAWQPGLGVRGVCGVPAQIAPSVLELWQTFAHVHIVLAEERLPHTQGITIVAHLDTLAAPVPAVDTH